jgi:hypothetical protein
MTMTRASLKLARRAVVAGIALAAVGALAASPAGAATGTLYTYLGDSIPNGFATMSAANGDVTRLSVPAPDNTYGIVGAEVFNGVGTAVGGPAGPNQFVITWDPATGARTSQVAAFVAGADAGVGMLALDTLVDGTTVTYVEYEVTVPGPEPITTDFAAIATVNRTTGELVPVIDLSSLLASIDAVSIATDPISGVTYLFLVLDDGGAEYSALDFGLGTFTAPALFGGTGFESGEILGADFDSDGTLYFNYANNLALQYELSSIGSPSGWPTAPRTFIGLPGSNLPDSFPIAELALTVGSPALASTGSEFSPLWLLAGTVAVLGGVVTVVTVSRKRRTA